jgi:hypothetical protein
MRFRVAQDAALCNLAEIRDWIRSTRDALATGERVSGLQKVISSAMGILGHVANALSLDLPRSSRDLLADVPSKDADTKALQEFDDALSRTLSMIVDLTDEIEANTSSAGVEEALLNINSASRLLRRIAEVCGAESVPTLTPAPQPDMDTMGLDFPFHQARLCHVVVPCRAQDTVSAALGLVAARAGPALETRLASLYFRLADR